MGGAFINFLKVNLPSIRQFLVFVLYIPLMFALSTTQTILCGPLRVPVMEVQL